MWVQSSLKLSIVSVCILLVGCKVSAPATKSIPNSESDEVRISPWVGYQASPSRYMDLLHTRLDLSFDWANRQVIGTATLFLTPYFYDQDYVVLDAKSFDIQGVRIFEGLGDTASLEYDYFEDQLVVYLSSEVSRGDTVVLEIRYTANPYRNSKQNERGLYFVNPTGNNPYQPRQIWTQGETSQNSRWFPTIDQPNERATQEIYLTVEDRFRTLSNGELVSSQSHGNGLRTDKWTLSKPHAPYLAMVSVNENYVLKDKWKGMEVNYWVDSAASSTVGKVFGRTPEMIGFFSEVLDYPFPWPKYDQIVVREFVSGAMENTTASVFMEELQLNESELLDQDWEDIISHELFHQWFGDLVTCESWANVSLNEAFATYGEYLWFEHSHGEERASLHANNGMQNYLFEAESEEKKTIRYFHNDPEDMFDSHSYSKGGAILHMLRKYVGDEAFFLSLSTYLKRNAFKSVEIHNLRLAFEEIIGEDLNWFFDQWFLSSGHPILEVSHEHQSDTLYIEVKQMQDLDVTPLFRLPIYIDLIGLVDVQRYSVLVEHEFHLFKIPLKTAPDGIIFDGDYQMVGLVDHSKAHDEWVAQYERGGSFMARYDAVKNLILNLSTNDPENLMERFLQDSSVNIVEMASVALLNQSPVYIKSFSSQLMKLTTNPNSSVRAAAIDALSAAKVNISWDQFLNDSSYMVRGSALMALLERQIDIRPWISNWNSETNLNIVLPVAYFKNQVETNLTEWYLDLLSRVRSNDQFYVLQPLKEYALGASAGEQAVISTRLAEIASTHHHNMTRLTAFQGLLLLDETEEIRQKIAQIRSIEMDEYLQERYQEY